jgi:DNA (cytosine-5)-methyltransferase 1
VSLTLMDEFCGFGGSSQGAAAVPGVELRMALNHAPRAIEVHSLNFPDADHYCGDAAKADLTKVPAADLFWASPACPPWSNARGQRRDFDKSTQGALFGDQGPDPETAKRRALMEEIPRYLRAMAGRGTPVLAGVVENVTECRLWDEFDRWRKEIEAVGYRTRLIALNSMHAPARRTRRAPQSRDRLYLAYWSTRLGRDPDWDRWLRPLAWCPTCDEAVRAVQTWKRAGQDMGRYRQQYVYRCPRARCRNAVVEPAILPAAAAIDWTLPGERIGDRARPLADKTIARIQAGIRKYARPFTAEAAGHTFERRPGVRTWPVDAPLTTLHTTASKAVAVPPMLVPAGGTWNNDAHAMHEVMRTRTTRDTEAVLVPPLLVPVEGRPGKVAGPVEGPGRTQTARNETGLLIPPLVVPLRTHGTAADVTEPLKTFVAGNQGMATVVPPFIAELRGGGSVARPVTEALATVSAQGNHHGLVLTPEQTMAAWAALYAFDAGRLRDHRTEPLPTQTTIEGDALVSGDLALPDVEDCLFRMLEPHEIAAGMAFAPDYRVVGNKRERVAGYGNAVTPPVAEVLISALVECITGQDLDR